MLSDNLHRILAYVNPQTSSFEVVPLLEEVGSRKLGELLYLTC